MLERRLRIITNISIGLPVFKATIYDENEKFITYVGSVSHQVSLLSISNYNDKMKEILTNRLRFSILDKTIIEIEEKNSRFKRAIEFYNSSFLNNNTNIRFTLLFSSLEALFNILEEDVTFSIAKYSSKILFLSNAKEKKILFQNQRFL